MKKRPVDFVVISDVHLGTYGCHAKEGGVDMWRTYLRTNTARLQKEVKSFPVSDYDLIINDFEPVSTWACKLRQKPCTR